MKAVRSHDYRIDRVRECEFYQIQPISAAGILPTRFFGGEKEQKRNPDCMAKRRSKAFGKARSLFLQKCLFPGRRAR